MEFKEYQHIQKIGISEVDGILNGKCFISYKIDGTNSCVFLKDDGSLGFGSRHKEVTKDSDQTGFVPGILSDIKTYTFLYRLLEPLFCLLQCLDISSFLWLYKSSERR